MPLAQRCPTGPFTMPKPRGLQPVQRPQTGPLNLAGSTRAPLRVMCIRQNPEKPWKYRGVLYLPGQRFDADPLDVPELVAGKLIQVLEQLPKTEWWTADGRILQTEPGDAQPFALAASPRALRIAQGTGYDPGNAAFRFHTAVNEYLPHASAFIRFITTNNNPFHCPTQYDACRDPALARALVMEADVLHCHVDWILPNNLGVGARAWPGQLVVRHYHGTQFNAVGKQMPRHEQVPVVNAWDDDARFAILVGARLTLCALRPGRIQWLPITVPVARYAAMAADRVPYVRGERPFRISHSPTKASIKGTSVLISAVKKLKKQGLAIELVMVERKRHSQALAMKAGADACFDSFALGIQGSGLEAAAMGQPVIAGDRDVRQLYHAEVGYCPYTFADNPKSLMAAIERLVVDPAWYAAEAHRVGDYVRAVHDYPAVAARYDRILTSALSHRGAA